MTQDQIAIVGNPLPFHVGAHFLNAAHSLNLKTQFYDVTEADSAFRIWGAINWRLRGRRPARLAAFGAKVLSSCRQNPSGVLLSVGLAPLNRQTIVALREMNVRRANFLTDDPWNPQHRAPWFLDALSMYDCVFSPRQANLNDLREHGCAAVYYLPFAYAPEIHFVQRPEPAEASQFECDVMFAGGADLDRIPALTALLDSGLKIALYGHDWNKHPELRTSFRGHADPVTLRKAVAGAKVCLCLVRRANRDGHSMRSYELPAMKGVILAEATEDHFELFGTDGECALFFRDTTEMITKAKWLVEHQAEARQMAECAYDRVTRGGNSYRDRLETILATLQK